jgi:hypothetical protein
VRHDDVHLAANQFGRETREPFVLVLGETVFKENVLAFDVSSSRRPVRRLRRGSV